MAADIYIFSDLAGSSRGLIARPYLPNNVVALLADIDEVEYEIKNLTDGGPASTGTLLAADVMKVALTPWTKDKIGYSALWVVPGNLWALGPKSYRTILHFLIKNPHPTTPQLSGLVFKLAWQNNTVDPLA